ncbi:MAG TPA: TadE/TadG family type IV pilus assembly protein [Candidatus Limnocylindria bacterium]|nr:TadE/TadG family type IV pilus assembly protein [Candidatus Limnocylindria bacterium]
MSTIIPSFIRHRRVSRGQSMVEMALILPFLLAFVGGATDFARAFQASITLESSARNAAEYVAGNSADSTAAQADATRVVCLESTGVPGYAPGTGPQPDETCTNPTVTVTNFSVSTSALGASTRNPIGTVKVTASAPFDTLLPYPFLPDGGWNLTANATYSVVRGR